MITLLTFPPSFGEPSHSPYCAKAICLLEMSGLPWQRKDIGDPRPMPHGRMPVIKAEGAMIADSHHIQAYLEGKGIDFNAGLSAMQKAQSHALIRMVEDHLSNGLVHARWLNDANWEVVREAFFGGIPRLMRGFVTNKIRKSVRHDMARMGIGQFGDAERLARLQKDIEALEATLGDKPFLFGDTPTAADAATAPLLSMLRGLPTDTGLRRMIRDNAVLCAYIDRARKEIYPA